MIKLKIKIAILGYEGFARRARKYIRYLSNVDISVYSSFGEESVGLAVELERNGIDAIITGQANYIQIKDKVSIPIIFFKVTFVDLMKALREAVGFNKGKVYIAYPSFDDFGINFRELSDFTGCEIEQLTYTTMEDLKEKIEDIRIRGAQVVIGTTLAVDMCRQKHMTGIEIYSVENVVLTSVDKAIEVIRVMREKQSREESLKAIINYAYEGIVSIDECGKIQVFNDEAVKLLGIRQTDVVGEHIDSVIRELKLREVLAEGRTDINSVERIKGVQIAVSRVPIRVKDHITGAIATFQDVNHIEELDKAVRREIRNEGFTARYNFDDLVGKNESFLTVINIAKKYARSSLPVLIEGETGTGKELFAQSMHNYSSRKNHPFVAINCASLPESLLESELFGYEPGAFTGASPAGKKGLFELANRGTLFLDEINSVPKNFQAKLLRVIEEQEIIKVGGRSIIPVDVRIISSTNVSIRSLIEKDIFREDLYYRIGMLKIRIPPLRERISDLPCLIGAVTSGICPDGNVERVLERICLRLRGYYFPGNVRELKCFLERFFILVDKLRIGDDGYVDYLISMCMDETFDAAAKTPAEYAEDVEKVAGGAERRLITELMQRYKNNKTSVAKAMGIGRNTLYRKLKKYNIPS